jgi:digeranylgeranylglycerophospholipid reductase
VYDVIVVGAGPTGSRAAFQLARLGHEIIVLEKRADIGHKACTGIISQECLSRYDLPREIIYRDVSRARLISPAGQTIDVQSPQPQAAVVNRQSLDRYLVDLTKKQGVLFYFRRRAAYISVRPEKVVVGVQEEGCDYQLEARSVVIAGGFGSSLAKDLEFGPPQDFAVGAQTAVELVDTDTVEVYFGRRTAPGFFAWLVPTGEGWGLAGLISRRQAGYYLKKWLAKLVEDRKIRPPNHALVFNGIPLKPVSRTFTDRVLVVGDAAGQVKPTTGGGIYFGLISADFAAQTLHKAITNNDFSAQQLSAYERDWQAKIGTELRREYMARKMFERLTDRQIDQVFSLVRSTGLVESLSAEGFSFDWHGNIISHALKMGAKWLFKSK